MNHNLCLFIRNTLILLLLIASVSGPGQNINPAHPAGRVSIHSWGLQQGFSENVYSLVQDHDGFLWFSNDFGVVRFDGAHQQLYNRQSVPEMTDDDCSAILIARDSSIYFGMNKGLILRYMNRRFSVAGDAAKLGYGKISQMIQDANGSILIRLSNGRIFRMDGQTTDPWIPEGINNELPVSLLAKGTGQSYFLVNGDGLYSIKYQEITRLDRVSPDICKNISAICLDRGNRLWIGTQNGAVYYLYHHELVRIPAASVTTGNQINCFCEDRDGNIWIGCNDAGIFCLSTSTGKTLHYNTENGLSSNVIMDIILSNEGDILAGTIGGGLVRFRKSMVRFYDTHDGLSWPAVTVLYPDPATHSVLVGLENGQIDRFSQGKFEKFAGSLNEFDVPVFSILKMNTDDYLFATMGPLVEMKKGRLSKFSNLNQLDNTLFHALFRDSEGRIWAGTDNGIYVLEGKETRTITTDDGLSDPLIFCFEEDHRHRIWAGTQEGGINIIDGDSIIRIGSSQGLSDNMVLSLLSGGEETMWIGTGHDGLNRMDLRLGKIDRLGHLIGNPRMITYLDQDSDGRLWMGTDIGIIGVEIAALTQALKEGRDQVRNIRISDPEGLTNASFIGGIFKSGCTTEDRKLWFGTNNGIVEIDPENLPPLVCPLEVKYEEVIANQKTLPYSNHYEIEPGLIMLQINYTSPTFVGPDKLIFRYKLEGFDPDWVEAGSRRSAYYTKVPPGDYLFRAEVQNHQGEWYGGNAPIRISILVKPFWYQTWWFYLLSFIIVSYGIYLAAKYRLNRLNALKLETLVKERTKELSEEIAIRKKTEDELLLAKKAAEESSRVKSSLLANMSHEFRTPMNGILGFAEMLNNELPDPGFRAMSFHILSSARRLMTTLNSIMVYAQLESGVQLNRKVVSIRILLEKILMIYRPLIQEKHLSLNASLEGEMLTETDEHLIYHCLINLVDNAVKFTSSGSISITASTESDPDPVVRITIADTGIGIAVEKRKLIFEAFRQADEGYNRPYEGSGLGLAISQRTLDLLGGRISIDSKEGQGSVFTIVIPALPQVNLPTAATPPVNTEKPTLTRLPSVLLVEDNEANIELTSMFLRRNFLMEVAKDSGAALDMLNKDTYDCILMDINLGVGMDGIDVIRQLRKEGPNMHSPVIAVTGYALRNEKDYIIQCGADLYLEKPFTRDGLLSAIREVLMSKRAT